MHRCPLAWYPDETQHRKTLQRVGVRQVMGVAIGTRRRKGVRQPASVGDRACQVHATGAEQSGFI